jgi:hypothetical protein
VASTACGGEPDCADTDPCTRNERCDLSAAACKWDLLDNDQDGHAPETCGGDDFDDADDASYPDAIDVCDGADNDRDGMVDELPDAIESCGEVDHAEFTCESGACVQACTAGYQDCDARRFNGCEVEGQTLADCPLYCTPSERLGLNEVMIGTLVRAPIESACVAECEGSEAPSCGSACVEAAVVMYVRDTYLGPPPYPVSSACLACFDIRIECLSACPDCFDLLAPGGKERCRACQCGARCLQAAQRCAGLGFGLQCDPL